MSDFVSVVKVDGALVVGAGVAGLFTALKLSPMKATVLAPWAIATNASSAWAQGGIAAALGSEDSPAQHAKDTVHSGAGIVVNALAESMAAEAPDRIQDLIELGVPFDRHPNGTLKLGLEAAHSSNRIVHASGDSAGYEIMRALDAETKKCRSIDLMIGYAALDFIEHDGRIVGIWAQDIKHHSVTAVLADAIVIATGGIGGLFEVTTNPRSSQGTGMAMAARAGAEISDPEFVQFHPTAINVGLDPAPLATEALRGEGAVLVNQHTERFMLAEHMDAELAPRDIVARAIHNQIAQDNQVFLDCRTAIGSSFHTQFPTVSLACAKAGIDPTRDLIPVAPAAHYHMGGIATNLNGQTTLEGLWACGEIAATGLHGANRLASNSLAEALVFGARIARDIKEKDHSTRRMPQLPKLNPYRKTTGISFEKELTAQLRHTMTRNVGLVRNQATLLKALEDIGHIKHQTINNHALNLAVTAAELIAHAALHRCESRGAHFRSDFPNKSPLLAQRTRMTLADIQPQQDSLTVAFGS